MIRSPSSTSPSFGDVAKLRRRTEFSELEAALWRTVAEEVGARLGSVPGAER